jgi:DNA-directed RNA polymerase specialized sigma24 family protein
VDIRTLKKEELEELYEAVLLAAVRLTRSRKVAEDLTQKTFEALLTTRPWDESRPTSLARHLYGIVKSLKWADRISMARAIEHQAAMEYIALAESGQSAETISLERAAREEQEMAAARLVETLRAKLAGRQPETAIADVMAEGINKPAELSTRLGLPVKKVYEAIKRIRAITERILAAEGSDDEEVES